MAKVGGACCDVSPPRRGRSGGWRTSGEKLFKELLFSETESFTIKKYCVHNL
jgi:hypothetical protein